MKKLTTCMMAVIVIFMSLSGIYASNIGVLDTEYTDNVYKFSDNADITLPFVRMCGERMTIDKDVQKSGLSFASGSLSVLNNLKGIQILGSSDTVRVTGNIEYGVILAPKVIIEGTIDKSLIIVSENITIAKNAVIKEDLLCSAKKLELLGKIEGNLLGSIDEANISGVISKDFRTHLGSIILNQGSSIQGNVYISSYNNINIADKYPNATIKIIEQKVETNNIDIWGIIRISLVFALIYLLVSNKTNVIKNALNKVKFYKVTTTIVGLASIILIPAVIILVVILALIGLGIIAVPTAILYCSFMFVAFILSILVVGSLMSEYILNKYSDKIKGNWFKLLLAFSVFFMLNILVDLPYVGYTLSVVFSILSVGVLFTTMFRKIKE